VAIVVTHDPRVLGFGDRIVTLEDGRVAHDERTTLHPQAKLMSGGVR